MDSSFKARLAQGFRSETVGHVARAAALILVAELGISARLGAVTHYAVSRRTEDVASIPTPKTLEVISLGHREWVADLLWVRALVYYGDTMAQKQPQRFLQRFAEAIEDVDPRFRRVYLWAATVSVYNARRVRKSSIDAAIRHLERGLQAFPGDPELIHLLGYHYFFELPQYVADPELQQVYRRRGAEYLRRASALGFGPPWMALAAVSALERAGFPDQAIEELRELYERTTDPQIREQIAHRLEEAMQRGAQDDPLEEETRRSEQERTATFPYLSPMQYLFLGPAVPEVLRFRPDGENPGAAAPQRLRSP